MFVLIAALLWGGSAAAEAFERSIVTGSETGTYFRIGGDIKRLAADNGIALTVVPSAGSWENVEAVFKRRNTQLGIVQADVLAFIASAPGEEELKRIARKVRLVFPLYREEVHLLARADIRSLADLAGQRVVVGEKNSGTYLTAHVLLASVGVRPGIELTVSPASGIEEMRANRADAVFFVAGQPAALFRDKVSAADGFHLVEIRDPGVIGLYEPASIPVGAYPWQAEEVKVVAIRAALITYDYGPASNEYFRSSCSAVGEIAQLIRANLTLLQNPQAGFHPKWREVELDRSIPGWQLARCAANVRGSAATTREACLPACAGQPNAMARKLCEAECPR